MNNTIHIFAETIRNPYSFCCAVQFVEPLLILSQRLPNVVLARHTAQNVCVCPSQRGRKINCPAEPLTHRHIEVLLNYGDWVALERVNGRALSVVLVINLAKQIREQLFPEGRKLGHERAKVVFVFSQVALVRGDVKFCGSVLRGSQVVVSRGR